MFEYGTVGRTFALAADIEPGRALAHPRQFGHPDRRRLVVIEKSRDSGGDELVVDNVHLKLVDDQRIGQEMLQKFPPKGMVALAWGENGFREVSNSKHEIRKPADMKGLKFRVVGSPLFNDIFSALGANPTQMSFADAQPALASGAVDGQENPLQVFTAAKMHQAHGA